MVSCWPGGWQAKKGLGFGGALTLDFGLAAGNGLPDSSKRSRRHDGLTIYLYGTYGDLRIFNTNKQVIYFSSLPMMVDTEQNRRMRRSPGTKPYQPSLQTIGYDGGS